jgi:hypothetical protein
MCCSAGSPRHCRSAEPIADLAPAENREHHDLVPLLANFLDNDVGAFDQFVRSGVEADAAHAGKPGC